MSRGLGGACRPIDAVRAHLRRAPRCDMRRETRNVQKRRENNVSEDAHLHLSPTVSYFRLGKGDASLVCDWSFCLDKVGTARRFFKKRFFFARVFSEPRPYTAARASPAAHGERLGAGCVASLATRLDPRRAGGASRRNPAEAARFAVFGVLELPSKRRGEDERVFPTCAARRETLPAAHERRRRRTRRLRTSTRPFARPERRRCPSPRARSAWASAPWTRRRVRKP